MTISPPGQLALDVAGQTRGVLAVARFVRRVAAVVVVVAAPHVRNAPLVVALELVLRARVNR